MRSLISSAALAAAGLVAFAGAPASAETVTLKAALTAAAETPASTGAGSGTLMATYDTATKKLEWTIDYSGLTGPATAAHFHGPAAVGKAGPVAVPLVGALASPVKGSATLTDAQAKDLMDGMLYINFHTKANPGGEIRGQVEKAM